MNLEFAITPCPNDTFAFYAMIKKIGGGLEVEFARHDIETLNELAFSAKYPITKLSFPAYLANRKNYEILDAGAALGVGTGPVFVARKGWAGGRVAVPGLNTTAALLYKFYAGKDAEIFPMLFSDILPAFAENKIEAGVLIHEGRFVYKDYGLELVQDLGDYWTAKTSLPVPLGCICIRRDFLHLKEEIEGQIRKSIKYAFAHFEETIPLVKHYALAGRCFKKPHNRLCERLFPRYFRDKKFANLKPRTKMKALVFATNLEADFAVKKFRFAKACGGKFPVYKNEDALLAVSGIGILAAALCAQFLLGNFKADKILNVGACGAL